MAEAELIPYSVVVNLTNKLTSSTFLDFGRINGVEVELGRLKYGFQYIKAMLIDEDEGFQYNKAVLIDEDEVQRDWEAMQNWMRKVKDVLLAADDLFDDTATENLQLEDDIAGKVRNFFSATNAIAFRFRTAPQIKKIRKDVNDLVGEMYLLNLSQSSESARRQIIIGREDEKKKIVDQLMKPCGNENVSVTGIFGVAGIGKTAFVQMVYNDKEVEGFFEMQMWVHVSHNFDVTTIVKKMLASITSSEISDQESLDSLLNKLNENLNGRKYLLVLDDMRVEDRGKWTQLKDYLMCGAQGSNILVTTRSSVVAEVMGASFLFNLSSLSTADSLSLFSELALRNDDQRMNPLLERPARQIARKCQGVPLVIRTMAGILHGKCKEHEWYDVLNGDFWKLGAKEDGIGIMSALISQYQRLSPLLKQCFAYCSLYPKGWEIEKNELIQLWVAQGYLECLKDDERHMEGVGNDFVKAFHKMSLFQDARNDEYGNLVSFKMHYMMHDLALLVAGNNDFYLDRKRRVNAPMHMCFSFESNTIDLLGSLDASRLRTFFLQRKNDREIAQMTGELSVIVRFKCLRVLNMSHSSLKKLPDLIGKLKHLRYLDLSWCAKLASLPKSIGNLVHLQTLKLSGCETLKFSTKIVTKLINLRHLEIHRCKAFEHMMPAGLGKLTSLQSLSSFYVVHDQKKKAGKLNELQNLNCLRGNLEINTLDQIRDVQLESQNVNLKDKKLLESLSLDWGNQDKAEESKRLLENLHPSKELKRLNVRWYPGESFSDWLSFMENLSHIYLFGFHNCQNLPALEHLPHLMSLEIVSMKALEYIQFKAETSTSTSTPTTFFNSLEKLKFSGCEKLRGWKWEDGNFSLSLPPFPKLSELIMKRCPRLTLLPTFPHVVKLELSESTAKPLRDTLELVSSSSSSTATSPLSKLKSLKIEGKLLHISGLRLKWRQNLTSLAYLEIGDVKDLKDWFTDVAFPCLEKIVIYACDIKDLPDELCNSKALEHIKILGCHKLASLPDGMGELEKLSTLEIWDCPLLVERCQSETGSDWPKISHVQNRILKQKERR